MNYYNKKNEKFHYLMSFFEKQSDNSYLVRVIVKPNAKKQEIINQGDHLIVFLRSKPIQNKANNELINLFQKKLKIQLDEVKILSGAKSSKKVITILLPESVNHVELFKKLIN